MACTHPTRSHRFAGQPNYDSEQVVAPLFSFAMPASATSGGAGGEAAPAETQAPTVSLKSVPKSAKLMAPPALPVKA
jgi:hypothetical protein